MEEFNNMKIGYTAVNNIYNQKNDITAKKDLTVNIPQKNISLSDKLETNIKEGKAINQIKFDDPQTINNKITDDIKKFAKEAVDNKKNYRDDKFLDNGNLACAKAISDILNNVEGLKNPKIKKDNINESECVALSKKIQTKGFKPVFNPEKAEKPDLSNFKEGDVVFFPRETEQWGVKKMGHVGIISKDENGDLTIVHNGRAVTNKDGKVNVEPVGVISQKLKDYLLLHDVSMIMRHKSNIE